MADWRFQPASAATWERRIVKRLITVVVMLTCAAIFTSGCLHKVVVPKQGEIPAPVIGKTICVDPADPTGQKIVPCPGGK